MTRATYIKKQQKEESNESSEVEIFNTDKKNSVTFIS